MKITTATFIKSGTQKDHFPDTNLPEIAFAGRSNVGKSSLMNTMMRRKKLVKVSKTPGRTQLLNWFEVNQRFIFCDLPGYGFAKVPKRVRRGWNDMIQGYFAEREQLRALVILVDARRGFEKDDLLLMEAAWKFKIQPLLVVTKCDKLKSNALTTQKHKIAKSLKAPISDLIWFSALNGMGRKELWTRIIQFTRG